GGHVMPPQIGQAMRVAEREDRFVVARQDSEPIRGGPAGAVEACQVGCVAPEGGVGSNAAGRMQLSCNRGVTRWPIKVVWSDDERVAGEQDAKNHADEDPPPHILPWRLPTDRELLGGPCVEANRA